MINQEFMGFQMLIFFYFHFLLAVNKNFLKK